MKQAVCVVVAVLIGLLVPMMALVAAESMQTGNYNVSVDWAPEHYVTSGHDDKIGSYVVVKSDRGDAVISFVEIGTLAKVGLARITNVTIGDDQGVLYLSAGERNGGNFTATGHGYYMNTYGMNLTDTVMLLKGLHIEKVTDWLGI